MTNHDPIFDLEACARALTEGHNPAEVAVRLQGIAERMRQAAVPKAGDLVAGRWDIFLIGSVVDSGDGSTVPYLVRVGDSWVWADENGPAFDWRDKGFGLKPHQYPDARFLGTVSAGALGEAWRSALEALKR